MRCLECWAEVAERAQACPRCGSWAPVEYHLYVAEGPADAVGGAAGGPVPAASHAGLRQQQPESESDPEVDRAELIEWVQARKFSTTRLRPGYDQEEVDAFLIEIRDSFLGVRQPSLTSGEIRVKQFSTTRLRRGYDQEEVDAFLDEAESRLPVQVLPSGARPGKNNVGSGKSRDDWRVCIGFGDLPRSLDSFRQALILHLESRLGDQVAVGSSATQIFVYAPSAGLADEAAQVARELLTWRDLSAPVRTDFWSLREWKWRDRRDDPSYDPAAHRNADRQEAERKRSVMTGVPAWQVRVEVPSHRDVVALAGHLAAQGWRVRRRPRSLIVLANCEDDAKGLGRALSGDGRADMDTAFRVGRVSYRCMYVLPPMG